MRWLAQAALLAMVAGCGTQASFVCETDKQCSSDGGGGRCELTGWCSNTDISCPSSRRYVELSGDDLGGACVSTETAGTGASSGASGDATGTSGANDGTSSGDSDETSDTPAPTAGGPEDPYGRCDDDCGFEDASCLQAMNNDDIFRMCSPPCELEASPSEECPASLGGGFDVGCLSTGQRQSVSCFIECDDDGSCPNGMICALSTVCSWE